jgi:FixJ family two-component response regulator
LIAIVDDDASVRKATGRLVKAAGFATEAFGSADALLGWARLNEIACLLLDVQMPGMNGLDLQDRLRATGVAFPIIFITGFPDEGARARALDGGAIGYLAKPVDDRALMDCIAHALGGDRSSASA